MFGASYGTSNTVRKGQSLVLNDIILCSLLVLDTNSTLDKKKIKEIIVLLKGVIRLTPPCAKYEFVWDTNMVLNRSNHYPYNDINLKDIIKNFNLTCISVCSNNTNAKFI